MLKRFPEILRICPAGDWGFLSYFTSWLNGEAAEFKLFYGSMKGSFTNRPFSFRLCIQSCGPHQHLQLKTSKAKEILNPLNGCLRDSLKSTAELKIVS
jgi:hypothetical protein